MSFLAWFLGEIVILLASTLLMLLLPEYNDGIGFTGSLIAIFWIFVVGCLHSAINKEVNLEE